MEKDVLEFADLFIILCGIATGTAARVVTLRIDSRQNPSYPNGVFINFTISFIASGLGAVAIPALMSRNFTAVTFLTLAIQHFRDIRKMERDSLISLEETEYTPRGEAYIDGISKTYETRYYICLLTSMFTVLMTTLLYQDRLPADLLIAAVSGAAAIFVLHHFTKGRHIGQLCDVKEGRIEVRGSELYVDDIFIANTLGTQQSREFFSREGMAFVVTPGSDSARLCIENYGQRQAILFEAVRSFGVKRYRFTRRNFEDGKIVIAFVPIIADREGIIRAICGTPVLESSRKTDCIKRKEQNF